MSDLSVGKEVLSYCSKCKLTLAHTIVAMKDAQAIHRVECRTCKNTHAYKDPSAVKMKAATRKKTTRKTSKTTTSVADLWMEAINSATAKSQPYSIKGSFAQGDIIDHAKFGPGVVDKTIDGDKIEVIFRHEIKTLIHNK
jgi:NACalpha-BTF3-like transcription factor